MADESQPIDQDEIEKLLRQSRGDEAAESAAPAEPQAETGADAGAIDQSEIEALLKGTAAGSSASSSKSPARSKVAAAAGGNVAKAGGSGPAARPSVSDDPDGIAPADVELLLNQAQSALDSINSPADPATSSSVSSFQLAEFTGAPASTKRATLDLLGDVELDVRIELGRTQMYLEDVLKLRNGSVVGLDKLAGDHVDVFVNGRLVARGEILVMNDNFCVRVAELVASEKSPAA